MMVVVKQPGVEFALAQRFLDFPEVHEQTFILQEQVGFARLRRAPASGHRSRATRRWPRLLPPPPTRCAAADGSLRQSDAAGGRKTIPRPASRCRWAERQIPCRYLAGLRAPVAKCIRNSAATE